MVDGWISCDNCGKRFGTFLSNCPSCGAKSSASKKKMGKWKKIGIIASIVVVAWVTINLSLYYSNPKVAEQVDAIANGASNQQSTTTKSNGDSFSGSVLTLYPTRNEIGTHWTIEKPQLVFSKGSLNQTYFRCNDCVLPDTNRLGNLGELKGLVEAGGGSYMDYSRVLMVIMKFDSHDSAYQPYHAKTQALYEKGGFEQVDASSVTGAECFGLKPNTHGTPSGLYCIKENVVFYIHNNYVYDENANLMFAKMVADKIS